MNRQQLQKIAGTHVRIRPIAKRFEGGKSGPELLPIDDDWLVERVDESGVHISNPRTAHVYNLGFDHIHHWTSEPGRGAGFGFLTLTVQINIGGSDVWIEPNVRPST